MYQRTAALANSRLNIAFITRDEHPRRTYDPRLVVLCFVVPQCLTSLWGVQIFIG